MPILGNQGRGSITEAVIQELLKLQGTMAPAQVISLMEMGGPTFAMCDHADHIHVGYTPDGDRQRGQPLSGDARPEQWDKLLDRIGELDSPTVPTKPSKYSLPAEKRNDRASGAHMASSPAGQALALRRPVSPLLPSPRLDLPGKLPSPTAAT